MTIPRSRSIVFAPGCDLTWGVATAAAPGELDSGDLCIVRPNLNGVLVAVIDGAGHGTEAKAASKTAAGLIEHFGHESPLSIMVRCHEGLRKTRGIVMTLAVLDINERTITWLGVGNVDAVLFRAPEEHARPLRALPRPGVVGYQLPALRAEVVPLRPEDTLIFSTDGIQSDFPDPRAPNQPPQELADRLLASHRRGKDDALVAVVRYSEGTVL